MLYTWHLYDSVHQLYLNNKIKEKINRVYKCKCPSNPI